MSTSITIELTSSFHYDNLNKYWRRRRQRNRKKKKEEESVPKKEEEEEENLEVLMKRLGLPSTFRSTKEKKRKTESTRRRKKRRRRAVGSLCQAYYQPDGAWYPVRVLKSNKREEYQVRYEGYGNIEVLPACWLRDSADKTNITSQEEYGSTSKLDLQTKNPLENVHDKYWNQRYRYFSRFDEGIKMDEEAWYSVTPERIAEHIAKRCCLHDSNIVIVDAFTGAGGNAIQFARFCSQVIAIDIDPKKIEIARHNAKIYGVDHKIEFLCGNFLDICPRLRDVDVVFLGPPWGGTDYLDLGSHFEIDKGINLGDSCNGTDLFTMALKLTKNLVYLLPRNVLTRDLRRLSGLHPSQECEMERNFINQKIKMVTVYFGDSLMRGKIEEDLSDDDDDDDGDDDDGDDDGKEEKVTNTVDGGGGGG